MQQLSLVPNDEPKIRGVEPQEFPHDGSMPRREEIPREEFNKQYPDVCRNFHKGNPESEAANLKTDKVRDRGIILAYLEACGSVGATCDQLEAMFGLPHQTCSARCSELIRDGLIVRKRLTDETVARRPTRTGSLAAVLVMA